MKGYYEVDGKDIICLVDEKEDKTRLSFDYADAIEIVNPNDVETVVKVTIGERVTTVDSIHVEFRGAGVNLPTGEVEWTGSLFGERKPERTPDAKRKSSPSPPAAKSSMLPFASKESLLLGQALRKKLKVDESDSAPSSSAGNVTIQRSRGHI